MGLRPIEGTGSESKRNGTLVGVPRWLSGRPPGGQKAVKVSVCTPASSEQSGVKVAPSSALARKSVGDDCIRLDYLYLGFILNIHRKSSLAVKLN